MNQSYIKGALAAVALLACQTTFAQDAAEEPVITFKTSIYETYGPSNAFHFVIGGSGNGYIDVDCGFGMVEYELKEAEFSTSSGAITATTVTCNVSKEGIVRVYGDASVIDYFDAEGCYISSIDIAQLKNLEILNLQHNELKGLDLTGFNKLQAVYLADNPYSKETPLVVGPDKPDLALLEIGMSEYLDPSFNLSDYPSMVSFDAYAAHGLETLDPTGCPYLRQLSLDVTPLSSLDVSKNPKLQILNISDTKITEIDLSNNPELTQLFAVHAGTKYSAYKLKSLDVTKNPALVYLFCGYNAIENLDLSNNTRLTDFSAPANLLKEIDLSANTALYNVNISKNYFSFATLPANPGSWNDYIYEQNRWPLNRSYKVGDELDFSATMLREGSETLATLYKFNEDDPKTPILMPASAYSFENGKLTLLEACSDSVFVKFDNSLFEMYPISTSNFVVKTAEDFGKDSPAISFLPLTGDGSTLTFTVGADGASPENPVSFSVDFGNGTPVQFTATGYSLADGCKVTGTRSGSGYVTVYAPENVDITALGIDGVALSSINVAKARTLRELSLTGTSLYDLDLSDLRCLQYITLKGNYLYNFSIAGKNGNFVKTALTELIIPGNCIRTFSDDGLDGLYRIDISDNELSAFTFTTAKRATEINASHNSLTEADLSKCEGLKTVDLSFNKIATLTLPEESVLENIDIRNNTMTIADLPETSLFAGVYSYAPQAKVGIPVKGPGADLSSQFRTVDGKTTAYAWFKADGTALTEGTDYSCTDGKTKFIDSTLGKVYCAMTHPAFPLFSVADGTALLSTEIEVAPMPTNVIASFNTPVGDQEVSLSLASTEPNTSIYIDWKGDGVDLISYDLQTSYTLFSAVTSAGANVKVYSYEDGAPISVFSITGATMTEPDLSKLTSLIALTIQSASLETVVLPQSKVLSELTLSGNNLSTIDLSPYKDSLRSLSLSSNKFSGNFDLSALKKLLLVSLGSNALTSVTLDNPELWFLDLSRNRFETIQLDGIPNIEQLALSGNQLKEIDVEKFGSLKGLTLDANRFTFATLPAVKSSYVVYEYGNQARLNAVPDGLAVDLSSQAMVGSTATTYRWFIDEPSLDEEGNWTGEELIDGDEYTVTDGVTTFTTPLIHLVGLLHNDAFPRLDLFTNTVNLSGVENVAAAAQTSISVRGRDIIVTTGETNGTARIYSAEGRLVREASTVAGENSIAGLPSGLYIVSAGNCTAKVAIR